MIKQRGLFILHLPPPIHGAAYVGAMVKKIVSDLPMDSEFINLKSSSDISSIGKFNFRKMASFFFLFFSTLKSFLNKKPSFVYFTISPSGLAFYRDFILVLLFKLFKVDYYLHYHSFGIGEFCKKPLNWHMTKFIFTNANVIMLSKWHALDIPEELKSVLSSLSVLNNSVDFDFDSPNQYELSANAHYKFLFLSNLIPTKGIFEVLEFAKDFKNDIGEKFHIRFAGSFNSNKVESDFHHYINKNGLGNAVSYEGVVYGKEKNDLLNESDFLIFPTYYEKEVYPIVILEALSYGLPIISTDHASIPEMVQPDFSLLVRAKEKIYPSFINWMKFRDYKKMSLLARDHAKSHFDFEQFKSNLIHILLKGS